MSLINELAVNESIVTLGWGRLKLKKREEKKEHRRN